MDILTDRRYIYGVITGVAVVYLYHGYRARKTASSSS